MHSLTANSIDTLALFQENTCPSALRARSELALRSKLFRRPELSASQLSRTASPRHSSAIQHSPGPVLLAVLSLSLPSPSCATPIPLASCPSLTPLISRLSLPLPLSPRNRGAEVCGPRGRSRVRQITSPFLSCLPFLRTWSSLRALKQSGLFKLPLCQHLSVSQRVRSETLSPMCPLHYGGCVKAGGCVHTRPMIFATHPPLSLSNPQPAGVSVAFPLATIGFFGSNVLLTTPTFSVRPPRTTVNEALWRPDRITGRSQTTVCQ